MTQCFITGSVAKDTILKAIHNTFLKSNKNLAVAKDTILKAIHNHLRKH